MLICARRRRRLILDRCRFQGRFRSPGPSHSLARHDAGELLQDIFDFVDQRPGRFALFLAFGDQVVDQLLYGSPISHLDSRRYRVSKPVKHGRY